MKKEDYNKIILDIESNSISIKYDFEIADSFRKVLEEKKNSLTPGQTKQLEWEFLLFRLMTKNRFENDGLKTERFKPMATFTDGRIFPDPNAFPPEALVYFEKRADESQSPIFKARYVDFLWEKSKSKQKHLFAVQAVEQYLLTIDTYEHEDAIIERLDGLQRAAELSLILEGKQTGKPMTDKVVAKLVEQIDKTAKSGNYRWLIEMFELVLALPTFFSKKQIKGYVALCELAVTHYHSDQNFYLQRHFLGLKAELVKLLDARAEKQKVVQEEIGQSFIDEAEAKSGSGIVKAHFLQEAIKHYDKLGNKTKVGELIAEIKVATKQAVEGGEFKQISTTIELKKEDWERMYASLSEGEKIPENIGTLPTFFPDWNHAVKMTKENGKKFVFMHLAKKVTYNENYPINAPQTPEQEYESQVMDEYRIQVELSNHWLTGCLRELIKNKKVSLGDFEKFFSKLKVLDEDTYETVLIGLEPYFKSEYLHSVYLLAPQLEDFLRRVLSLSGGQTTTQHVQAGAFTEKNLNRILIELKPYIPERLFRYISWVMDDYRGYNLRYKVGHGFFKKKHANPIYPTAIIHIFCLLIASTKISVKEQKQDGNKKNG